MGYSKYQEDEEHLNYYIKKEIENIVKLLRRLEMSLIE